MEKPITSSSYKKLEAEFLESRLGKPFTGSEAFRNKVGRVIHGLWYKHDKACKAVCGGVIVSSLFLVATPIIDLNAARAILVGAGVPAAGFGAVPTFFKNHEKPACQYLMNHAVRKANAFNEFLKQKELDPDTKSKAIQECLKNNMPIGCFKEYMNDFPNAIEKIINHDKSKDLPVYCNKEVFEANVADEINHRNKQNGGILKGAFRVLTGAEHKMRKQVSKIADKMYQDYLTWQKNPDPNKLSWNAFSKQQNYFTDQNAQSAPSQERSLAEAVTQIHANAQPQIPPAMQHRSMDYLVPKPEPFHVKAPTNINPAMVNRSSGR